MSLRKREMRDRLMAFELKTGSVWSLKNRFREFLRPGCQDSVRLFFTHWTQRAVELGLMPMNKVKELLHRHFDNIVNYNQAQSHQRGFRRAEQQNSALQSIRPRHPQLRALSKQNSVFLRQTRHGDDLTTLFRLSDTTKLYEEPINRRPYRRQSTNLHEKYTGQVMAGYRSA